MKVGPSQLKRSVRRTRRRSMVEQVPDSKATSRPHGNNMLESASSTGSRSEGGDEQSRSDLAGLFSTGRLVWDVIGAVILAGVSIRLLLTLYRGDWATLRSQPGLVVIPVVVLAALVLAYVYSRRNGTEE